MRKKLDQEQYPDASSYSDADITPEFQLDPVTPLVELAKAGPILKRDKDGRVHGIAIPNGLILPDGERDIYHALGYDACLQILKDNKRFSSEKAFENSLKKSGDKNLTVMDDPEHRHYKKLILPSFAHRIVNEELERIARPVIASLLDQIAAFGEAELISSFTVKFPFAVVATLFGVPLSLADECAELTGYVLSPSVDMQRAVTARDRLYEIYRIVIDEHRKNPADDLTTMLLETEVDGDHLTDAEISMFIFQIVGAGLDTTARQMSTLIMQLLDDSDQFALLKKEPNRIEAAIKESLRTCPAASVTVRVALEDTKICGVNLPRDAGIYVNFITANRDEQRWSNSDEFDITREMQASLSFGYGIHSCLGQHLAMVEMKIAMQELLVRLPNLRKDERRWDRVKLMGYLARSPTQLPVRWDID